MREIIKGVYGLSPKAQKEEADKIKVQRLARKESIAECEDRIPIFWHDCTKYKNEPMARVKLDDNGNGLFKCPYCGFEYSAN